MDNEDLNLLEQAFLREKVNFSNIDESGIKTTVKSSENGLIISHSQDITAVLNQNKIDRELFQGAKRGDQNHHTKLASIPTVVYNKLLSEAEQNGITCSKEKAKYVVHCIKTKPEFALFLSVPKSYIRK